MSNDLLNSLYLSKSESLKGYLLTMRDIILSQDKHITHVLKYGMPFFCYKGKMFCYLWIHKRYNQPYIGIVEGKHIIHPQLIVEKRSRMKIMLFDPDKNLPLKTLKAILTQAINLYKSGVITLKN